MSLRPNEPKAHPFRSDRLVVVNGAWFIATREGIDVGPFPSRQTAMRASSRLATLLVGLRDSESAKIFIREFQRREVD